MMNIFDVLLALMFGYIAYYTEVAIDPETRRDNSLALAWPGIISGMLLVAMVLTWGNNVTTAVVAVIVTLILQVLLVWWHMKEGSGTIWELARFAFMHSVCAFVGVRALNIAGGKAEALLWLVAIVLIMIELLRAISVEEQNKAVVAVIFIVLLISGISLAMSLVRGKTEVDDLVKNTMIEDEVTEVAEATTEADFDEEIEVESSEEEDDGISDEEYALAQQALRDAATRLNAEGPQEWDPYFYHYDVLNDGNSTNNMNMGPNPLKKGKKVKYYLKDFYGKWKDDPMLVSEVVMALDYTIGTNYTGDIKSMAFAYLTEREQQVLEARMADVDIVTRILAGNKTVHDSTVKALKKFFKHHLKAVKLKNLELTDQIAVYSETLDGIPNLCIIESSHKKTLCLVFEFRIKGGGRTTETIIFRIPCGYQWAVESGNLPEEAVKNTTGTTASKPSGSSGRPGRASKPSPSKKKKKTEKPGKASKPKFNKDPKDGPTKNAERGDGPDPDTNNPSDPNHSTKDDPKNNTTSGRTSEDVAETNKTQKTGSDSNKPSTDGGGAKEHNNGDSGTGSGGANQGSKTDSKPSEIGNDGAGDPMD